LSIFTPATVTAPDDGLFSELAVITAGDRHATIEKKIMIAVARIIRSSDRF
jgi:hypothetical protein